MMFFSGFYQRLRPRQTWNIVLGSLASILRISLFTTPATLVGAHLINAVILWGIFTYTFFAMKPGNIELMNMARSPSEFNQQRCRQLVEQWSERHTPRALLSCIAALVLAFSGFCTIASHQRDPHDHNPVQFYEQALQ
ncbi:hypothetical protein WJX73_006057 [Symbiochloris irregularis]|uniref:Uncharacterized protein n=1 Tax=Symbiochloris irregularis TaxID=706552 RepID=A0AAW1NWZ8_9CHLO